MHRYSEEMLNIIADMFMNGFSVPQIRGTLILRYGTKSHKFTDEKIQKHLDLMEFNGKDN